MWHNPVRGLYIKLKIAKDSCYTYIAKRGIVDLVYIEQINNKFIIYTNYEFRQIENRRKCLDDSYTYNTFEQAVDAAKQKF